MVVRILYTLTFLLLSKFYIAQKATVINLTQEEFNKANTINDLIKELPKDCKVDSYVYSIVITGSEKTEKVNGNALRSWLKSMKAYSGNKLFIDKINSDCKSKHNQKYKVVITE